MKPPRFGLRTVLVVTGVVALWLSTLMGYRGSNDFQAFIWTAIVVTSAIAAASCSGRRRAFWAGFFGTMLLMTTRNVFEMYGAKLEWTIKLSQVFAGLFSVEQLNRGRAIQNINTTFIFLVLLAASVVIGFLSVFVYDECKKMEK